MPLQLYISCMTLLSIVQSLLLPIRDYYHYNITSKWLKQII